MANALNFGGGSIYGPVATGPGGSIPAALNVGSHAWLAGHPGVDQPGWITSDMNVSLPDVQAPYNSGLPPMGGIVLGDTNIYTYILSSGNWQINGGSFNGKVLVTGKATLYVAPAAAVNFSPTTGSRSSSRRK